MQQFTTDELFSRLSKLIMEFCETLKKSKDKDFTRTRKLPLERLLATILHLCASSSMGAIKSVGNLVEYRYLN